METFSALLALSAGIYRSPMNSLHKGKWRGALMFSLICALNKRFSKQSWGWWFETPLRSLWRHFNVSYVRSWQIVFWCVARESTHVTCQLIEMVSLSKPAITHHCIHRTPILPTFILKLCYCFLEKIHGAELFAINTKIVVKMRRP